MSTAIIRGGGECDNGGCGWTMAGSECRIMASLAQPDRCVGAQTAAERDKDQQPQWENTEASIISVAVGGLCNSLGSATDMAERGLRGGLAAPPPPRPSEARKQVLPNSFSARGRKI